ncbi:nucleoside diphosphate kinase regulator [Stenotrophomonas rhizophila]|nr:nucleoside diphosphate kinase regulator [Stenotrophomonas rhizophila]
MDRLEAMLDSPAVGQTPAALALAQELNRATVVAADAMPAGTVMMHSRVECEDELQNEKHVLTLVYPREADVEQGKVSILAPVGTALLGLSVGQSMDWDAPGGRKLRLRVTAVHNPNS